MRTDKRACNSSWGKGKECIEEITFKLSFEESSISGDRNPKGMKARKYSMFKT